MPPEKTSAAPNPAQPAAAESLAAALALVQSKLPPIGKSKTATVATKSGGSYSYDYADLAQVSQVIVPMLGAAGLAWITKPTLLPDGKLALAYRLLHTSGESEEGLYPLPSTGSPQEIGSAITYARRYTLCSVTGVAPEQDDDDGAAASRQGKAGRGRTAQREQPPAAPPAEPPARPRRTAQRTRTPAGPPLPGERGYDNNSDLERPATTDQLKMLHATLGELNVAGREARLRLATDVVGRDLGSSSDLTVREASTLIDTLVKARDSDNPAPVRAWLDSFQQPADAPPPTSEPGTNDEPEAAEPEQ